MDDARFSEIGPQFGEAVAGARYRQRPTRYGIAPREDGSIATVRITGAERISWDLPGGMIDPGETSEQALCREFIEETGWSVEPVRRITAARQFTVTSTGEHRDNHSVYYACRLIGETGGKIEEDHELVWLDPLDAMRRMRHDAAAWAIAKWLRLGARCAAGD